MQFEINVGKFDLAAEYLKAFIAKNPTDEELLQIRERTLGPQHPDVGTSLRNLAVTLRSLKQFSQADELLTRAINQLSLVFTEQRQAAQTVIVATVTEVNATLREIGRVSDAIVSARASFSRSSAFSLAPGASSGPSTRPAKPITTRSPRIGTRRTMVVLPGANPSVEPEAISR